MGGHVVVVGGGIGGLAAAVALHGVGWDVTVLERAPELAEVGAGVSLWPNAVRALQSIHPGLAQLLWDGGRCRVLLACARLAAVGWCG